MTQNTKRESVEEKKEAAVWNAYKSRQRTKRTPDWLDPTLTSLSVYELDQKVHFFHELYQSLNGSEDPVIQKRAKTAHNNFMETCTIWELSTGEKWIPICKTEYSRSAVLNHYRKNRPACFNEFKNGVSILGKLMFSIF